MYLIITTNKGVVEQAKQVGAAVFEYTRVAGPNVNLEWRTAITMTVDDVMAALEFMPNLKGYDYIKYIMERCAEDTAYHHKSITKEIYPDCADVFGTTATRVERAFRHAIERSFEKNPKSYDMLFNRSFLKVPTNSEFISMTSKLLAQMAK